MFFFTIGIVQLDNDAKGAHPKISIHSAKQRAPLNFNVNYVTVIKYTYTYQFSYKTEIFKIFYSMHFYLDLLMIKNNCKKGLRCTKRSNIDLELD